jgi:hypothetical protein
VFRIGNEGVSVLSWVLGPEDVGGFARCLSKLAAGGNKILGLFAGTSFARCWVRPDFFQLELKLGRRPERAAVARYTQTMARCSVRCGRFVHEQCHNPVFIGHHTRAAS